MASKVSQPQLAILAVALIVAIAASSSVVSAARPCKTLLISSYTFSLRQPPQQPGGAGFVAVFAQIRQFRPLVIDDRENGPDEEEIGAGPATLRLFLPQRRPWVGPTYPPHLLHRPLPQREMGPVIPSSASGAAAPYDLSSLRDRTKDILSVVVALLFGVGCGALTAATMYLAWSLFAAPRGYQDDDDFDSSDDDDEPLSPKKIGYVKIPPAADDPAKQIDSAKQAGV